MQLARCQAFASTCAFVRFGSLTTARLAKFNGTGRKSTPFFFYFHHIIRATSALLTSCYYRCCRHQPYHHPHQYHTRRVLFDVIHATSILFSLTSCSSRLDVIRSDHEVIAWEVLGNPHPTAVTSTETTGWDISGWDPAKESEGKEKKKTEERRRRARECYLAGVGRTPILTDDSTKEEVT